jgi:hypothetical protein
VPVVRRVGTVGVIAGGLLFLGALTFLPYVRPSRHHETVWELPYAPTRYPLILTVIAILAIILAATSLRVDSMAPLAVATSLSFYLLGAWFPLAAPGYNGLGSAFWLGTAAAAFMSFAGALALTAPGLSRRSARPS